MYKPLLLFFLFLYSHFSFGQSSNEEIYQNALHFQDQKEYLKAIELYNQISVDILNNRAVIPYNKGICYYYLGYLDEAYFCLIKASKIDKNDYQVPEALGGVFEKCHNTKRAIFYYRKAIKMNHGGAYDSYKRLIEIYEREFTTKSINKGILVARLALNRLEIDPYFIMKRGILNYYNENYQDAKKELSYVIDHYADSISLKTESIYFRGLSFFDLLDYNNAAKDLNLIDTFSGLDTDFYFVRAYVNCKKDTPDFPKAFDDLLRYKTISHDATDTTYLDAYIYNGLHKYEEALIEYNLCLDKSSGKASYPCLKGRTQVFFNTNRFDEGCADIKKCRSILRKCLCKDSELDKLISKYRCK